MNNIDRDKKSEMKLIKRANYDSLTELFNRIAFNKHVENELLLAKIRKDKRAILFIDIDDFKHYNDNYGHACGDDVLKFIAQTIKNQVLDCGFAGRYGGDEFVICLNSSNVVDNIENFAKAIIENSYNFV